MGDYEFKSPYRGIALSGGGFRATLFHIGSLWRINELGLLEDTDEVTSVSGGSITAAYLGLRWQDLSFEDGVATNFDKIVARPLRDFCSRTVDVGSILGGVLNPFRHPSHLVIRRYKKHLFGDATLQDLPADGSGPRFTIYATSLQTGRSVRFSRPYLADYLLGLYPDPELPLAVAVAASSAFPPPLCPVKITLDPTNWEEVGGADLFHVTELKSKLYLGDGGIYDNLGLERLWDRCTRLLVSDAGSPFTLSRKARSIRWSLVARTKRTLDIMSDQTRALRARRVIHTFESEEREGAYWGIGTSIEGYGLATSGKGDPMTPDTEITGEQKSVRTRLNKFSPEEQGRLINWGYALADAAVRRYVMQDLPSPGKWPLRNYAFNE